MFLDPSPARRARSRRRRDSALTSVLVVGVLVVGALGLGAAPAASAQQATVDGSGSSATPAPTAGTGSPTPSPTPSATAVAPEPSPDAQPSSSPPVLPPTLEPTASPATDPPSTEQPTPAGPPPEASPSASPGNAVGPGTPEGPTEQATAEQTTVQATTSALRIAADVGLFAAGVPAAPATVWTESFEQGLTTTTPSGLGAYASGRYTASTGWAAGTNCTGVLVSYGAAYPNSSFCPTQPYLAVGQSSLAARETRRLADVLGQVAAGTAGSSSALSPANGSTAGGTQANHALTAMPIAAVTGGTTVARTAAGIGVTAAASRYYALRLNAAGTQCGANDASLALSLVSGGSTLLSGFSAPVVPCASTGNVYYTSPTLPGLATLGGIVDPAWALSVRAAEYRGTNTALLSPSQIASAQVQVTNSTTAAGGGSGVDDIRVLDVTPALDAAFTSPSAAATVPTTLTYTVTNSSDLLVKTDWGFTATLPTGLVVAPTPTVAGSCTNAAGSAFAVTAAAGSSTITAVGGDLVSGAASCTISVDVIAATVGTYSSGTVVPNGLIASAAASVTVQPATTITVRKIVTARTAPTDQFALSLRAGTTVLASATTSGAATGLQAAQISAVAVQPGSTYTIAEAPTSGAGLGYANGYECTLGGTVIASGSSASGAIAVPNQPGAQIVCTFTNTPQNVRLLCDSSHFYTVGADGSLAQADAVTGATAALGTWSGVTSVDGLGVTADGTAAFAIERSSGGAGVGSVLKWTPVGGFQALTGTSFTTVAGGSTIAGPLVGGAVNPANGRYYFGKFAGSQFYLWSFTESNPAASRFAFVGTIAATSTTGNGDLAFDSRGNLYVVGAATVGGQAGAGLVTVTAAAVAAAGGNTLASNTTTAKAFSGTDASPAFADATGLAFSPRGTGYLGSASSAYEFDLTTGTRVAGTPRVPVASSDLATCSSPSTLTVQKNVVGRAVAVDQFQLALSSTSPAGTVATATTVGTSTGRQTQQIGPVPAPAGGTFTVAETMAAGSVTTIGAYSTILECWADGVRISTGTTPSGTVTMPARSDVDVTCTFVNSPRPPSTISVTTQIVNPTTGAISPAAGWTAGVSATALIGSVTVLPAQSPTQQTDAAGLASWTALFGSALSRADIVVSEELPTGYAFASGTCTVGGLPAVAVFLQTGVTVRATLAAVPPEAPVACTIVNRPVATLTLVKEVSFGAASASLWTLTATGPLGALPGPIGSTGTAFTTAVPVTPGAAYRLAETGGPATYVQSAAWRCVTAGGQTVAVTSTNDVTLAQGDVVTCTVTNATATVTLLKQVISPQTGFQAADWTVTATPAILTGGLLPIEVRAGAEYSTSGNPASTFPVRPGHSYTLTEAPTVPGRTLAYRQVRLEQLVGATWVVVPSATISAPAAGQSAIYRFVNAPVAPTTLPLTGGAGTDAFAIAGISILLFALTLALRREWRRSRRRLA